MPLEENQVGQGRGGIDYSAVTSCLTLTVALADGMCVGAHLALLPKNGRTLTSALDTMKHQIAFLNRAAIAIYAAGAASNWDDSYFSNPPDPQAARESPQGGQTAENLARTAITWLGLDKWDGEGNLLYYPLYYGYAGDRTGAFRVSWNGDAFSVM